MNTATSFRLHLREYRSAVMIYYIIIFIILCITSIGVSSDSSTSGLEASTSWFLFVCGMCSFRASFLSHLQFGSTRKTLFKGWLSSAGTICLGMSILNLVLLLILNQLLHLPVGSPVFSIQIDNVFLRLFAGAVYYFFEYFLLISIGYLITVGFYRLNKTGKWIVSILMGGCGMLAIFLIERFESYIDAIFLYPSSHPFIVSGIFLVVAAMILSFCWLLIRKMPAKTA